MTVENGETFQLSTKAHNIHHFWKQRSTFHCIATLKEELNGNYVGLISLLRPIHSTNLDVEVNCLIKIISGI